jgi:hypothetical protein
MGNGALLQRLLEILHVKYTQPTTHIYMHACFREQREQRAGRDNIRSRCFYYSHFFAVLVDISSCAKQPASAPLCLYRRGLVYTTDNRPAVLIDKPFALALPSMKPSPFDQAAALENQRAEHTIPRVSPKQPS